jgi:acyl carrier protein
MSIRGAVDRRRGRSSAGASDRVLARPFRAGVPCRVNDVDRIPLTFGGVQAFCRPPHGDGLRQPLAVRVFCKLAMSTASDVTSRDKIFEIVQGFLAQRSLGRTLLLDDNLRDAGITSLDMVNIVLQVESACDVTIPDREITPANFKSVAAIDKLICNLRREP